jgi:hypothetical protein
VAARLEDIRTRFENETTTVHIIGFAKIVGDISDGAKSGGPGFSDPHIDHDRDTSLYLFPFPFGSPYYRWHAPWSFASLRYLANGHLSLLGLQS